MDQIITIKATKGLGAIVSGNGENVSASLYRQDEYNRDEDGQFVAKYDDRPFPKARKYFAPQWDSLRRQWHWGGSGAEFKRIVDELMLRYPKGHRQAGELIVAGDVEKHRKDFKDPIFHHPDLISKSFVQGGVGTLNLANPIEAFYYYASRDRRDINDETGEDGKPKNPMMVANATMVFSNPSRAAGKKHKTASTFLEAMQVIIENQTNIEKLRIFIELFDVVGVSKKSELNELVPALTEFVKDNGMKVQKGTGFANLNEALIAHSKMTDEELEYRYVVKLAKRKGHIRIAKNGFLLNGKLIEGPKSLDEIFTYFSSGGEAATKELVGLLDKMRELREIE